MRPETASLITAVVGATGVTDPERVFTEATRLLPAAYRIEYFMDLTGDDDMEGYEGGCVRFVEPVVKVTKVSPGDGDGSKARVYYADGPMMTPQGFEDPGYLETEWLGRDLSDRIVVTALASIGQRCLFYKRNRTDESGKVTQGFRTLVWLQPLVERPPVPPVQENPGGLSRQELTDRVHDDTESAIATHDAAVEESVERAQTIAEFKAENAPDYTDDPF